MPLVALLDCLSRYSQTAKLGRVLRASSGNFSTVPHMAQPAQTNTFAQELCPLDIACKHSPSNAFNTAPGGQFQSGRRCLPAREARNGTSTVARSTTWMEASVGYKHTPVGIWGVQGRDSQTSQCGTSEYQYHFLAYNLTRVSARIWYFLGNTHRCQPSWETERGPSILFLMEVAGWILDMVGKPTCGKRFPPERVKVWREASERVVGFVLFCFDCIAKQVGRK